jgi:hypothetical protein
MSADRSQSMAARRDERARSVVGFDSELVVQCQTQPVPAPRIFRLSAWFSVQLTEHHRGCHVAGCGGLHIARILPADRERCGVTKKDQPGADK